MTARGKGQRPPGPPTEPIPAVTVAPEFKALHRCRTMPERVNVWQVPPRAWELRVGGQRVAVAFCPICGIELEVSP